jgi:spore coat polysaccharide biosynthesis protein SpsF
MKESLPVSGNPAVFVQVRYSSTRLPGKVLMTIGGKTIIQRLYDRLSTLLSFPVFFLTSNESSDDIIIKHLEENNISYFRGSLNNVLDRFIKAGDSLGYNEIFRITGDNPFIDVHTINENWQSFMKYDYVDNIHSEGSTIGTGFEFVKLQALKSIPADIENYYKEHVTAYIRDHASNFNALRFIPKSEVISRNIFLTCDYPEDLKLIRSIYKHFEYSNHISIQEILKHFYKQPDLNTINRHLHQTPSY